MGIGTSLGAAQRHTPCRCQVWSSTEIHDEQLCPDTPDHALQLRPFRALWDASSGAATPLGEGDLLAGRDNRKTT